MNVFGKLADCIKKGFGRIKILLYKIGIALMKFQCGNFIITQVFNA